MNHKNNIIEQLSSLGDDENEDAFRKTCQLLAKDIRTEQRTIVQLVEELGSLLTHTLPSKREIGLVILNNVLEALPHSFLNELQLDFISKFYCDRLKDHSQIIPVVIKGILILANCKNLPDGAATSLLKSLFLNVHCQQQKQPDRYNEYCIFEKFLETKLNEIQAMNYDFILGVLTSIDGERDPNNLLFLFNWMPELLRNLTMGHIIEEVFEAMACYFPVDFKGPSVHPSGISREKLADALCPCLCATSKFGQFAIPLALEKLDSSLQVAKTDSLKLLTEGCKKFNAEEYRKFFNELWEILYKNLLQSTDREVIIASLNTLTAIINKLSLCEDYERILIDVIGSVKGNLLPDAKLFEMSVKILLHITKASKRSASFVIHNIMPVLTNLYNITTTKQHKVLLFQSIISFTKTYIEVHDRLEDLSAVQELNEVPSLCLKTLMMEDDDSLRVCMLNGLAEIFFTLDVDLRCCFYKTLCHLIVLPQNDDVRAAMLLCLRLFAERFSIEILENVLNKITPTNIESLELYLGALASIVNIEFFTTHVLSIIVKYCLNDVTKAEVGLKCLSRLLLENEQNISVRLFLCEEQQFIGKLISWVLQNLNNEIIIEVHQHMLECVSSILLTLIGVLNEHQQDVIVTAQLTGLIDRFNTSQSDIIIVLLNGVLLRMRKNIPLLENHNILFDIIEKVTLESQNTYITNIGAQLLANIINKLPDDVRLDSYLSETQTRCLSILKCNKEVQNRNVLVIISWITKSLLMRGHRQGIEWTKTLIELLENGNNDVATSFQIVISSDCESLSTNNYCNIKLLYQQKFFIYVIDSFACNFKNEPNYLMAIGYLLKEVPKNVFLLHFTEVFRFLILCLDTCNDCNILHALLQTLCELIQSKEPVMEEYFEELLPRLCNLTSFKSSMQVRIAALSCLQHYASAGYPLYKLLPQKQNVIRQLTNSLDDPKRLVRKEAMNTRLRWYLLDALT